MSWSVAYSPKAERAIRKLDAHQCQILMRWIDRHLEGCDDPRALGRALVGAEHLWRYRVGDYRIIAEIQDGRLVVLVVNVAHRREAYR